MPSDEKELKQQDRETEVIVIGRAGHRLEIDSMKFRRRPDAHADGTEKLLALVANLIGVTIDEENKTGLRVDEEVAFVDISQDGPRAMQLVECGRRIPGDQDEIFPGQARETILSLLGTIDGMNRNSIDLPHDKSDGPAA